MKSNLNVRFQKFEQIINTNSKQQPVFFLIGVIVFLLLITKFLIGFGPIITMDIVDYSRMSKDVINGFFPHSPSFSPGYPFFIGITSKLLSIHEAKSIFLWVFILIFLSIIFSYNLIKLNYKNEKFNFLKISFLSFLFLSHWAVFKILLTAHADALFLCLLLGFFYFLFLWLRTFNLKWFVIISLYASLCIWVKYNGLILLPFLIISSLVFGKNKFKLYLLPLPVILGAISYFSFKQINGTVIKHFQSVGFYDKLEFALRNFSLVYSNLVLSGRVYFSVLFTNSIQLLMPDWFVFVFFIAFIFLFIRHFFFLAFTAKIENVFLLFSFFYWLSFFILCQYTAYEEINTRTLMPSVLSFLLWILFMLKSLNFKFRKVIIIGIALSLSYSFYYIIVLCFSMDKKNTFNYLSNFNKRKSVIELKNQQKKYDFNNRIYTNEYRPLVYAFDYSGIDKIPSRNIFDKGKLRELNTVQYDSIRKKICSDFTSSTSALLLIDCPKLKDNDLCFISKFSKIYRIDSDILIINSLKDSLNFVFDLSPRNKKL